MLTSNVWDARRAWQRRTLGSIQSKMKLLPMREESNGYGHSVRIEAYVIEHLLRAGE